MAELLINFAETIIALHHLLGYSFVPGSHAWDTAMGDGIKRVLKSLGSREVRHRDLEIGRLAMLVKHLTELKEVDKGLFRKYRGALLKADSSDNFYGLRFEVNIAASLVRKKVNFGKQESPDFVIWHNSGKLGIECGSARIRKQTNDIDFNYKIIALMRDKGSKPYCAPTTSLFIDITNLLYTAGSNKGKLDTGFTKQVVGEAMTENGFGNVMMFSYIYSTSLSRFESNYLRVDSPYIDSKLKSFLNQYFKCGGHFVPAPGIPREG